MDQIFIQLPQVLLPWYELHKRDLPWRRSREPYGIWLSEIMLQQTRVEAVKGYYTRFLNTLPTIEALAKAEDTLILKLWEGLGYYSRVRNLKKAAQVIMTECGGQFPREYEKILALPGIGPYTAGAISSIAFNAPHAAVDGNVLRVVSRLTADDTPIDLPAYKAQVQKQLEAVYPSQAGDFTQALMELGATVCGPDREPMCESCPCRGFCRGYSLGIAAELPKKRPKKGRRLEEKTVFILECQGRYALQRRPEQGLLAGLWQFPEAPGKLELQAALDHLQERGIRVRQVLRRNEKNHVFTHILWEMVGLYLEVTEPAEAFYWLTAQEIERTAALPTAYRQFWEDRL